jgi:hypothetical protein
MKTRIAFVLGLLAGSAMAAPLPAAERADVIAVLDKLAASTCQFQRNGDWYSGTQAKDHLLRKLAYVEKNASIKTALQFVEVAATKSSSSGDAYQVRCGQAVAQPSAVWLTQQLLAIRAAKPAPAPAVAASIAK